MNKQYVTEQLMEKTAQWQAAIPAGIAYAGPYLAGAAAFGLGALGANQASDWIRKGGLNPVWDSFKNFGNNISVKPVPKISPYTTYPSNNKIGTITPVNWTNPSIRDATNVNIPTAFNVKRTEKEFNEYKSNLHERGMKDGTNGNYRPPRKPKDSWNKVKTWGSALTGTAGALSELFNNPYKSAYSNTGNDTIQGYGDSDTVLRDYNSLSYWKAHARDQFYNDTNKPPLFKHLFDTTNTRPDTIAFPDLFGNQNDTLFKYIRKKKI